MCDEPPSSKRSGIIDVMAGDERQQPVPADVYPNLPKAIPPQAPKTRRSMSLAVLISTASTLVGALISAAWAVYFGMMFYGDYWSNRDCFNAGGYCDYVDAGGEDHRVYSQNGIFFGVVAAICLVSAIALLLLARRTWHRYGIKADGYAIGTAHGPDSFEVTEQVGPPPLLRYQPRPPAAPEPQ
ncbi:MAG: hypothetical protein KDB49_14695 [Mycobacterium sp.]|nr:hypothetical protein [Mycobacterium sp.]